jgi:fused signal recognition particle receptor
MKFFDTLAQTFANKPIDWDELEAALIRADLGTAVTMKIIDRLKEREAWSLLGIRNVIEVARDEILRVLPKRAEPLRSLGDRPSVVLIVGVNGTGKTTTTAKLAHHLKSGGTNRSEARPASASPLTGKGARRGSVGGERDNAAANASILLVAADTFRAAAIEQLGIWADRLALPMVRGQYDADPAALCYDAYQSAVKQKVKFMICDTAGRLHTKINLMAELQKVKRSLAKQDATAPQEILLVIDATTGGNALSQARQFHEALGLTGVVVTKLDGSGKGGIVVAIQNDLGIPTRFVGTGEKIEDLSLFDAQEFVDQLL